MFCVEGISDLGLYLLFIVYLNGIFEDTWLIVDWNVDCEHWYKWKQREATVVIVHTHMRRKEKGLMRCVRDLHNILNETCEEGKSIAYK